MNRLWVIGAAAAGCLLLGVLSNTGVKAQQAPAGGRLEVLKVQGSVYLIAGAGPNITVQVGDQYAVLVDAGPAQMTSEVRAAVRSLTSRPIGLIINTGGSPDRIGGNEELSKGGFYSLTSANQQRTQAAIVSNVNLFNRLLEAKFASGGLPTDTYDQESWRLHANDEALVLEHPASAVSDSDTVVFFRRSDVVSAGGLFDMTKYPMIDAKNGGTIDGILKELNHLSLDIAVPKENEEGGTLLIPGYGHVTDRNDLANYRDMLTIIRDRIRDLVKKGRTLEQVKSAKPTYDYDGGYGVTAGPWTTDMFVETIYREMSGSPASVTAKDRK
jgi:cyclase